MCSVKENSVVNTPSDLEAHTLYYACLNKNEIVEPFFDEYERKRFVEHCYTTAKAHRRQGVGKRGIKSGIRQIIVSPEKPLSPRQEKRMEEIVRFWRNVSDDTACLVAKHTKKRDNGNDSPHYHIAFPMSQGKKVMETEQMFIITHAIARQIEIEFGHKFHSSRYNKSVANYMRSRGLDDLARVVEARPTHKPSPRASTGSHRAAARVQMSLADLRADFDAQVGKGDDDRVVIRDLLEKHRCSIRMTKAKNGVETVMLFHANDDKSPIGSLRKLTGVKTSLVKDIIPYLAFINRRQGQAEPQPQPQRKRPEIGGNNQEPE